jgi:hypothetical protein
MVDDKIAVNKKLIKNSKNVPETAYKNKQIDLFQTFLCNGNDERGELSNALDLWDSIPRYSVSRQAMQKMRTAENFLEVLEITFSYRGRTLTTIIYPARIKNKSNNWVNFYPSAREELIEQALRKIASEQNAGYFDKPTFRSGVRFSLYMLRRELESQGHSLRYIEIIEGLDILSLSNIEIIDKSGEKIQLFARSPFLPTLLGVKRADLQVDPNAKWLAQFHPLVTQSIDELTTRQFNYKRLMNCRTQLARWLINQLVLKYTAASIANTFEMRYSTIKRNSAMLNGYQRERSAIEALDAAWEEVKEQKTVSLIKKNEQRGLRGKLEDVIYTIYPSPKFAMEQKAANRRRINAQAT